MCTGRTFRESTGGYSAVLLSVGHQADKHALKVLTGIDHIYADFIDLMLRRVGGKGVAIRTVVLTEIGKPDGAFEDIIQSKLKEAVAAQVAALGAGPVVEPTVLRQRIVAALRSNIPKATAIVSRFVRIF